MVALSLVRKPSLPKPAPSVSELRQEVQRTVDAALEHVEEGAAAPDVRMRELERGLREFVFAIGRALLVLFLALVEQGVLASHMQGSRFESLGKSYCKGPAIARNLARSSVRSATTDATWARSQTMTVMALTHSMEGDAREVSQVLTSRSKRGVSWVEKSCRVQACRELFERPRVEQKWTRKTSRCCFRRR